MRLIIFFLLIFFLTSCNVDKSDTVQNKIAMHTLITIHAIGFDSKTAVEQSFARIDEIEKIFDEDIEKIQSNAGEFVQIHDETFELIELSQKISAETNGAYDITIGKAKSLWKFEQKIIPSAEKIDDVKKFIGFDKIQLDKKNHRVMIIEPGMMLDIGGIAKGFAADEVRKIFAEYKIDSGLIQIGVSTTSAVGLKPDGSKWKVGIKNPRDVENFIDIVELENQTLSTSGDYERFFISGGIRYHHILDPSTCYPVNNGIASVSVIVPNSIEHAGLISDAYSTANFITGEKIFDTRIFREK